MAGFRWMNASLLLILLFNAAPNGQTSLVSTVREGDDIMLTCESVTGGNTCDGTTWIFSGTRTKTAVTIFEHGRICQDAESKSDRLSITEKCSLVVKNVTAGDAGLYSCRQFDVSGRAQGEGSQVYLSVVTLAEHENVGTITLFCSVLTQEQCRHKVEWLVEGNEEDFPDLEKSPLTCSASVTFTAAPQYLDLLRCKVTDRYTNKTQVFTFSSPSPGEKAGLWWLYVGVAATMMTLSVVAVRLIMWKKSKGEKRDTDRNVANPAEGVSYASIAFTRKTNRNAQDDDDDDEGAAVTYSSVKTSSSSH